MAKKVLFAALSILLLAVIIIFTVLSTSAMNHRTASPPSRYDPYQDYGIPNAYGSLLPMTSLNPGELPGEYAYGMPNADYIIDQSIRKPVSVPGSLEGMLHWCDLSGNGVDVSFHALLN